jgi:pSer/pThr/pTyr-binding forkhead associated (FHA) protein
MSDEVIFRAINGALKDEEFVFEENGLCLIGRSRDCALQIPKEKDMRISRRHCLLIINPPKIRIRDLGSRNGTYVNGEQAPAGTLGDVPEQMSPQDIVLNNGDKVSIGETEFEILIPSQQKAGTSVSVPPPGTKIIKLAKPEKTLPGSLIPQSTPVDTGFFIPPKIAQGGKNNTATAPMTVAFTKPKMNIVSKPGEVKPQRLVGKKVATAETLHTIPPAPAATLILKAKPPANPPPPKVAQPIPAPLQQPVAPVQPTQQPKKVLKGKIVKKHTPPPQPAAPENIRPAVTEIMDNSNLADDIKLGAEYKRKEKAQKRITKFKIKGPK